MILLLKEEFSAIKSRLNATTFGDHNTSFFHVSPVVRRHGNKIKCIMDGSGEWIYEQAKVKEHIQAGFEKLYTSEMCMSYATSSVSEFSCYFFSKKERNWIEREVIDKEIRIGLWAFKSFKALGQDGLNVGFFQHFWQDV